MNMFSGAKLALFSPSNNSWFGLLPPHLLTAICTRPTGWCVLKWSCRPKSQQAAEKAGREAGEGGPQSWLHQVSPHH